jgi:SAM-dependent methyltransferase
VPDLVARRCPVCDAAPADLLYAQHFSGFDGGALLTGYDVVTCRACGTVYADHIPSQDAFDRYYAEMSKYEYGDKAGRESPHDLGRFAAMADACLPHMPPRARVLDIGCATGGLLDALRARGAGTVHGLDPSAACARAAKALYDIDVSVGTLGALPPLPAPFDLVSLVGVVEHVRDVRIALERVRGLLAPDGMVFVEVPDAEGFADWPGPPFQEFSVEHVNFLSATSTTNLMGVCGFVPIFCERTAREWAPDSTAPVVYGLFRRSEQAIPPRPDATGLEGVQRYVQKCAAEEGAVAARLASQLTAGEKLCVWGAGTHTQRLVATGVLDPRRIVMIVDGNAHYQGRTLGGAPIVAPAELTGRSEPILISSRTYQREMVTKLRDELKLPNRLITLYDL